MLEGLGRREALRWVDLQQRALPERYKALADHADAGGTPLYAKTVLPIVFGLVVQVAMDVRPHWPRLGLSVFPPTSL